MRYFKTIYKEGNWEIAKPIGKYTGNHFSIIHAPCETIGHNYCSNCKKSIPEEIKNKRKMLMEMMSI